MERFLDTIRCLYLPDHLFSLILFAILNFLVNTIFTATAFPISFSILQRAQDLANVTAYREWVLLGYLVCPDELLRVTSIDIALVTSIILLALSSFGVLTIWQFRTILMTFFKLYFFINTKIL